MNEYKVEGSVKTFRELAEELSRFEPKYDTKVISNLLKKDKNEIVRYRARSWQRKSDRNTAKWMRKCLKKERGSSNYWVDVVKKAIHKERYQEGIRIGYFLDWGNLVSYERLSDEFIDNYQSNIDCSLIKV